MKQSYASLAFCYWEDKKNAKLNQLHTTQKASAVFYFWLRDISKSVPKMWLICRRNLSHKLDKFFAN